MKGAGRILILMISGGGGHRSAARAIAEALRQRYGERVTSSIVDVSKAHWLGPVNRMDEIYRWLTSDGLWLWRAMWRSDDRPGIPWLAARLLTPLFAPTLRRIYRDARPDLVVAVHGFVNHLPLRVLRRELGDRVPFVTVVTDMVTAHPVWFCPEVDACLVPTDAAQARALRYGMPPERVEVVGQPVGLAFAEDLGDPAALRRRFGLDPGRPCALVVGGGDGMGPLYETARAIDAGVPQAQQVIVAGRNVALRRRLEATSWSIPTRVFGFVDTMPQLMKASDLLVTKAGPGTLAEAFTVGLPVVIFDYIPGQEAGNVQYVLEHEAGAYAPTPDEIAHVVRAWLRPDAASAATLRRVVANAAALARPEATLTIAQRLYALLQGARDKKKPPRC